MDLFFHTRGPTGPVLMIVQRCESIPISDSGRMALLIQGHGAGDLNEPVRPHRP